VKGPGSDCYKLVVVLTDRRLASILSVLHKLRTDDILAEGGEKPARGVVCREANLFIQNAAHK